MEAIVSFLEYYIGVKPDKLHPDTDIEPDTGCSGEDFFELMDEFTKRFPGDYTGYRWYFHHHPESIFTSIPCLPDGRQVPHIPLTPQILLDSAIAGHWIINYPDHIEPDPALGTTPRLRTVMAILLGLLIASAYVWFAVNFRHSS